MHRVPGGNIPTLAARSQCRLVLTVSRGDVLELRSGGMQPVPRGDVPAARGRPQWGCYVQTILGSWGTPKVTIFLCSNDSSLIFMWHTNNIFFTFCRLTTLVKTRQC